MLFSLSANIWVVGGCIAFFSRRDEYVELIPARISEIWGPLIRVQQETSNALCWEFTALRFRIHTVSSLRKKFWCKDFNFFSGQKFFGPFAITSEFQLVFLPICCSYTSFQRHRWPVTMKHKKRNDCMAEFFMPFLVVRLVFLLSEGQKISDSQWAAATYWVAFRSCNSCNNNT